MSLIEKLTQKSRTWIRSKVKLDMPTLHNSKCHPYDDLDELVPPDHLLFDGSTNQDEFKSVGEGFTQYFLIAHAQLKPDEKVLDVGCGIGQKARVLANYLNQDGSYDGIDIVPKGIEWCTEHYKKFPNFRFRLADLYSEHYNPNGQYKASEYQFPYKDNTFDLVFLSSVFYSHAPKGYGKLFW